MKVQIDMSPCDSICVELPWHDENNCSGLVMAEFRHNRTKQRLCININGIAVAEVEADTKGAKYQGKPYGKVWLPWQGSTDLIDGQK